MADFGRLRHHRMADRHRLGLLPYCSLAFWLAQLLRRLQRAAKNHAPHRNIHFNGHPHGAPPYEQENPPILIVRETSMSIM